MKDVYDMDLKVVNFKPPKFVRFSTISLLNFGVFLFHKNVLNMINRIINFIKRNDIAFLKKF